MDAKITSPHNTKEGTILIHPHSDIVYVYSQGHWKVHIPTNEKVKRLDLEKAYNRAMQGI